MQKLSVLMPVYNESRTLRSIVERVLSVDLPLDIELVCVNDHSTDESGRILDELASSDPRIRVIHQPVNMGKGRAIRTAVDVMNGDIAIVQDADLEYDPNEYPRLLQPLLDGRADAVYGSRFAASEQRRVLFFWHSLGNKLLTMLSNMANDLNLTDMETCYKAIRGDLLKSLRLTSDRFGFEPEVTARLAQWGARIYEVPISYHGRTYAEGKNIGWRDGVEALWLVAKFRFFDTRATDDRIAVTRQSLGKAKRFRTWVLSRFGQYLGRHVIELDAGPGHLTSHLLDRPALTVVEADPVHLDTLRRRFGHLENLSLFDRPPENSRASAQGRFDTAIVFDALQRVQEPKEYLARLGELLRPGGHILIQVPGNPALFGPTDEAAGHVRRFNSSTLEDAIRAAGFEPLVIEEFNRVGAIAWRLHHLFGRREVTSTQAKLFDLMVPALRRLEPLMTGSGLSLLAVARVP